MTTDRELGFLTMCLAKGIMDPDNAPTRKDSTCRAWGRYACLANVEAYYREYLSETGAPRPSRTPVSIRGMLGLLLDEDEV